MRCRAHQYSSSFGILCWSALAVSTADAATITGTVKGPDGQAFRGAFVQARSAKTKITLNVLSDNQGRYRVENLPAGDYRVRSGRRAIRADTVNAMALTADQNATHDFALKASYVRWTDISMYQGIQLLPEERGKNLFFIHCMACHGFETRMAREAQRGRLARLASTTCARRWRSSSGGRSRTSLIKKPRISFTT